jgi:uncharacterized protein YciI
VVYEVGPGWVPELPLKDQEHALGHIRFMRRLLSEGIARLAGPFTAINEQANGGVVGLVVLNVPVEEAAAVVAGDPAVAHGLLMPSVRSFYPLARP